MPVSLAFRLLRLSFAISSDREIRLNFSCPRGLVGVTRLSVLPHPPRRRAFHWPRFGWAFQGTVNELGRLGSFGLCLSFWLPNTVIIILYDTVDQFSNWSMASESRLSHRTRIWWWRVHYSTWRICTKKHIHSREMNRWGRSVWSKRCCWINIWSRYHPVILFKTWLPAYTMINNRIHLQNVQWLVIFNSLNLSRQIQPPIDLFKSRPFHYYFLLTVCKS